MLATAMKRLKKNEKGFTLIELLAVIVILGIIAAIAVPLIGNIITKSRTNADLSTARQIYDAARLYAIGEKNGEIGDTDVTLTQLQAAGYLDDNLTLPSTKKPLDGANTIVEFTGGEVDSVTLDDTTKSDDSGTEYDATKLIKGE
ncbi:type IV pilus assembly protein PilA [Paenibacillus phyllosphaerae]|uniref:Type IV pilus assembly protein PilA n=1 Tax=Paenibacillus phyllosphaerae TaxID=274593 RepID=A0A7W5AUD5_9BACL|nr:type II secretion system protein [Paenibacillus phyllosphaerae]MBB3108729.1 type IV pilus assembly protein PilA [Paenibacillus phyllosphaerae]